MLKNLSGNEDQNMIMKNDELFHKTNLLFTSATSNLVFNMESWFIASKNVIVYHIILS